MDPFVEGAILGEIFSSRRSDQTAAAAVEDAREWKSLAEELNATGKLLHEKLKATRVEVTAESVVVGAMIQEVTEFLAAHPQHAQAFRFSAKDAPLVRDMLRTEVTRTCNEAKENGIDINDSLLQGAIDRVKRQIDHVRG